MEMDNQKVLEKNVEKANQQADSLRARLEKAAADEKQLRAEASAALIAGRENGNGHALRELLHLRETIEAALATVEGQLKQYKFDLDELRRLEEAAPHFELFDQIISGIRDIDSSVHDLAQLALNAEAMANQCRGQNPDMTMALNRLPGALHQVYNLLQEAASLSTALVAQNENIAK